MSAVFGRRLRMRRTKSRVAIDRVGIYARIGDIPEIHRLSRYRPTYRDRDVWTEFCEEYEYGRGSGRRYNEAVDRAGSHWLEHMGDLQRHHALATPTHVERWCRSLLDDKSPATAYNYWIRIKRFYDWLLWHTDHPHRYSPVMLAVIAGGATGDLWGVKIDKWEAVRQRNKRDDSA